MICHPHIWISYEITCIKNDINEDRKHIIYLKDDKVRHDKDIIS